MCVDVFLFFLVTRSLGISTILMRNGSHASVRGVGMVHLTFTSRKIVQHVNNNLVSGCILCKDGFKYVFKSNKVVSKYGPFIGKGYECGGSFCLSPSDFCNKVVNHNALVSTKPILGIRHFDTIISVK